MFRLIPTALSSALALTAMASEASAQWPERPVTMIVAAGAGGGTDATARLLAVGLEERFGQPFNVVNRAEGGGITGLIELANAEPDGYTIGFLFNYAPYRHLGMGDLTSDSYTPIAQYNFDSAAIHVRTDSRFQSLNEVIDALREDPQSITIGCGATCPSSYGFAFSSVLLEQDIDIGTLRWIPSQGAAAGLQELVAGGIDILTTSVPESASMLDAGEIRTLGVLSEQRLDAFPDIPTAAEQLGSASSGGSFRAVVGPAGLPEEIQQQLEAAIEDIYNSDSFQSSMNERGFGLQYRDSDALLEWMKVHEAETEAVLRAAGLI